VNERRWLWGIAGGLFLLVVVAYAETMGGSTSFWDCGEFIATAYTLGIPHPPGTPLYVVLGRVFTLLPLPLAVAAKVNFMSALFGALGVVALFFLIVDFVRERRGVPQTHLDRVVVYGSGLVGALFTAWSNTYWANSVEAEVYAIASCVMGLTTILARRWARNAQSPGSTNDIYLIIYLLSLSVGFHLGSVLTYPAIALYCLLFRTKSFKDADLVIFSFGFFLFLANVNLKFGGPMAALALLLFVVAFIVRTAKGSRFVAISTALFLLGLSIHLFLLIRSGQNPNIDEADPQNWTNLLAVLRREQYPPGNMFVRKGSWHFQIIDHFWRYFTEQYQLIRPNDTGGGLGVRLAYVPIAIGICGMVSLFRSNRKSFVLLFGTFAICSLGLIVFLNFSDGTRGVQAEVRERDYFYSAAFYMFGAFIGIGSAAVLDWFFGARATERRARLDVLGYAGGIALFLVLSGMLYSRYHFEHDRTHERVPWGYGYNMLAGLEPNALIFTNGDNDTFPLWYQQEAEKYRPDVRVVNLSLLNTSWYIHQLKQNKPQVEINWPDQYIDDLRGEIDKDGRMLQPRDLAVRQIVRDNYGKRPIYFAVTIPRESLRDVEDYLVLEGLVYKLTNTRGKDRRDYAKIEQNATAVYRYDGILKPDGTRDETVYRDLNQRNLVQNYAGAFIRLAQHDEEQGDAAPAVTDRQAFYQRAVDHYLKALEISPDFDLLKATLGTVYIKMGRAEEALALYQKMVEQQPDDPRWLFQYVQALFALDRVDEGLERMRSLLQRMPDEQYVNEFAVQALYEVGRASEAEKVLTDWESRHPGNTSLREYYQAVKNGLVPRLLGPSPHEGSGRPDSATPVH
jgi:tetratricopeptide (TPR) repeat protein